MSTRDKRVERNRPSVWPLLYLRRELGTLETLERDVEKRHQATVHPPSSPQGTTYADRPLVHSREETTR